MTQRDRQFYTVLIVIIFSFFIIIGLGHFRTAQLMRDILVGEQLQDTLTHITQSQIDIQRLKLLKEDLQDPYAQELRGKLAGIRAEQGWANIYLVSKFKDDTGRGYWGFLLDSRFPDDPLAKVDAVTQVDTVTSADTATLVDTATSADTIAWMDPSFMFDVPEIIVEKAYRGQTTVGEPYTTNTGSKVGGFAPVGYGQSNEDGDDVLGEFAVAVLCVEYDADTANGFIYKTLYIQCGVLALGAVLIYVVTRKKVAA
ncbi:MAG: hypothetical protein FWG14_07385 [Peptococcaceae bacterium]|nr:hypothetical protein [Peptococcaceae bacterium]